MLIPSPVTARTKDMTEAQHRALGQYFERHVESETCRRDPLLLALVLAGDKPAVDYSPSKWEFPEHPFAPHEGLQELCDVFNLSYRRIGSGVGSDWIVAPSPGRLDLLPSTNRTDRNAAWHRRLGIIFGYPPEAIDYFIESTGGDRTHPEDLVVSERFPPEEIAYTRFVFYRHDDSIEGYERAIKMGKTVRRRISDLADEWELPALDTIAEDAYEDGVRVFSNRAKGRAESFRIVG